jgi:high-affinity iron transporter
MSTTISFFVPYSHTASLGADADDAVGDGPGTFRVSSSVWHLDCCNPEDQSDSQGWSIFAAIFGWTNSATYGSVISYVLYWVLVVACLVVMKWREGRIKLLGIWESKKGRERREKAVRDLQKELGKEEIKEENIEII